MDAAGRAARLGDVDSSNALEERSDRNLEAVRELHHRVELRIAFAPLKQANLVPMQAARRAKILLRELVLDAKPPQVAGEDDARLQAVDPVAELAERLQTKALMPIRPG